MQEHGHSSLVTRQDCIEHIGLVLQNIESSITELQTQLQEV